MARRASVTGPDAGENSPGVQSRFTVLSRRKEISWPGGEIVVSQSPLGLPLHIADRFGADDASGLNWDDVWRDDDQAGFVLANILHLDILQNLHATTAQAIEKKLDGGLSEKNFVSMQRQRLQEMGWWGRQETPDPRSGEMKRVKLGTVARLKVVYGAILRVVLAARQRDRIDETKESHPYLLYQLGPSRVHRPMHVRWHGMLLRADDQWWDSHFPPNGFGCRCWVRQVSKVEADREGWQVSERPTEEYYTTKDPMTGCPTTMPVGLDPGWNLSHRRL